MIEAHLGDEYYGYGRIDAYAALQAARNTILPPTPTPTRTPIPTPVDKPANQINLTNEGVDPPVLTVALDTPVVWFNYSSWDFTLRSGIVQRAFLPLVLKASSGVSAVTNTNHAVESSSPALSGTFAEAFIVSCANRSYTFTEEGTYPYYGLPRLFQGEIVVRALPPTLTPTASSNSTATGTATPTPTETSTPVSGLTATATPSATSTATVTPTTSPTTIGHGVTWRSVAPMLTPRSGLGLATGSDGKLYAIGGENDAYDPVQNTLSSVEMYDPSSNTWTPRASMPTKRAWLAAVTASNGKIYAIGGAQCQNCPGLSTVEEYDPTTDTWATKASMPTARQGLAAVAAGGKVYALGGYNGQQLSTVEEYDPCSNTWRAIQSMPSARQHLAAVLAPNGLIYAIGGGPSNKVEAYNPASNTWSTMSNMPTARWALGAAVGPNGRIYAIGGNGPSNTVEEYDPATNSWTTRTSMPTARQSPAVAAATNGKIYAVGGEQSALQNLATVEEATIY